MLSPTTRTTTTLTWQQADELAQVPLDADLGIGRNIYLYTHLAQELKDHQFDQTAMKVVALSCVLIFLVSMQIALSLKSTPDIDYGLASAMFIPLSIGCAVTVANLIYHYHTFNRGRLEDRSEAGNPFLASLLAETAKRMQMVAVGHTRVAKAFRAMAQKLKSTLTETAHAGRERALPPTMRTTTLSWQQAQELAKRTCDRPPMESYISERSSRKLHICPHLAKELSDHGLGRTAIKVILLTSLLFLFVALQTALFMNPPADSYELVVTSGIVIPLALGTAAGIGGLIYRFNNFHRKREKDRSEAGNPFLASLLAVTIDEIESIAERNGRIGKLFEEGAQRLRSTLTETALSS